MTYIAFVLDILKEYDHGTPIYTNDIAKRLAEEYGLEVKKANAAVAVAMKRITEGNKYEGLRFYQKGIYYIANKTPFGETGIDKEALIQEKYLRPDIGYEAGYSLLHRLGLTTQMPAERILVTNKAKDCIRADKNLGVYIRPPKVAVTKHNKCYLQLLDAVEILERAPVDAENPYEILAQYLKTHNMRYQQLLAFADRYYNKNAILQIAHIASMGGIIL